MKLKPEQYCFRLKHLKVSVLALKQFTLQILFQPISVWSGTCDASLLAAVLCERAGVSTAVQKWVNERSDESEKTFKESLFIVGVIRQNNYKLEPLTVLTSSFVSQMPCQINHINEFYRKWIGVLNSSLAIILKKLLQKVFLCCPPKGHKSPLYVYKSLKWPFKRAGSMFCLSE